MVFRGWMRWNLKKTYLANSKRHPTPRAPGNAGTAPTFWDSTSMGDFASGGFFPPSPTVAAEPTYQAAFFVLCDREGTAARNQRNSVLLRFLCCVPSRQISRFVGRTGE